MVLPICRASEYYQAEALKADSIPSLQRLCERSLAESAVEPRTCLQIMEYADACGAEVLKQFCLGVLPSAVLPLLFWYNVLAHCWMVLRCHSCWGCLSPAVGDTSMHA